MTKLRGIAAMLAATLGCGLVATIGGSAGAAATTDRHPTRHAMGALPPKQRVEPAAAPARRAALPATVDLSGSTVPVGYQGSDVQSCVSWTLGYAMLGWYGRHDYGAAFSMAPMFLYSQTRVGGNTGSYPSDALHVLKNQGIDTAAHYSHDAFDWWDQPTAAERANAQHYTIRGFRTLFANDAASTVATTTPQNVLMSELAAGHPVAMELTVRAGFENIGHTTNSYDTDTWSAITGMHDVLAVGYDANGVLFQNSWGNWWGFPAGGQVGGFGRIGWNVVRQDVHELDTIMGFGSVHHDFNGDGANDLVARRADGAFFTYRGSGTGGFAGNFQSGSGTTVFNAIVPTRDFNGNGTDDVIARKTDGTLWLYDGTASGTFGAGVQIGNGWNVLNTIVAPGDFNGDGTADLIGRKADGTLWLYGGDGAGGWVNTFPQIGNGWNVLNTIVAPGDFNGDGTADLIGRKADGTLWLYGGDGAGGWVNTFPQIGNGWNVFTTIVAPGDWNLDFAPDLMGRRADGTLWLYKGNRAGGFLAGYPQIGTGWNSMNFIG